MSENFQDRSANFIAILTIALIIASLWIFSPFLRYLLVAAVLSLATSHTFVATTDFIITVLYQDGLKSSGRHSLPLFLRPSF